MKPMFSTLAATVAAFFSASAALAHPGHGQGDGSFSLVHYLTEPEHLLMIAGMLVGGLLLVHLARKAFGWIGSRAEAVRHRD